MHRLIETALFVPSATVAELLFGIAMLPKGNRKERRGVAVDAMLEVFDGRILSFDTLAAKRYADLSALAIAHHRRHPDSWLRRV